MARIKPQALIVQIKRKKGPTRTSGTTIILCNLVVVMIVLTPVAIYRHWSPRFDLSMMREVAELANVDRAALWHQLCASEDDIIRMRQEMKAEASSMAREKATPAPKLSDSEAANRQLKSEMRAETDRLAREMNFLNFLCCLHF
ncbi:Cyclophilin-like peptidyl-prolyl cis-trans isomerase family protein [Euphorbia peplus]|nr:Cyclophilin-like peptidyl-prolyl cis-trans isomerase family protein [Euphorbia peplus]